MARYVTTVSSPAEASTVFSYLADFANTASWDPGVRTGELLSGTAGKKGAVYRLTVSFLGRSIPLDYHVLESQPPRGQRPGRVILEATTSDFRSYDVITVNSTADGCEVTYDADLALRGLRRPFDPFLRLGFSVVGSRARRGLESALNNELVAS